MASVAVRARFSGSKPVLRTQRAASVRMEAKNGLFYSTSSGKTQDIAELIKEKLGDSVEGPFEPDEVRDRLVSFAAFSWQPQFCSACLPARLLVCPLDAVASLTRSSCFDQRIIHSEFALHILASS